MDKVIIDITIALFVLTVLGTAAKWLAWDIIRSQGKQEPLDDSPVRPIADYSDTPIIRTDDFR